MSPRVSAQPFGHADGQPITLYTLENGPLTVAITDFGGAIVSLYAPDHTGALADVIFGPKTLDGFVGDGTSYGALIGRYANRIANARFTLDGHIYHLTPNPGDFGNCLHGGDGFAQRRWFAEAATDGPDVLLHLRLHSPHGDHGFPGNIDAHATYRLTPDGTLEIAYHATTDRPTHLSFTNHAYFNLAGRVCSVLDHHLWADAQAYTPVNAQKVPTGEIATVTGTPFDFQTAKPLHAAFDRTHPQLRIGKGYDHNWVLRLGETPAEGPRRAEMPVVACLWEPQSQRHLGVQTTEPGIQIYTGNHFGPCYPHWETLCQQTRHPAICLETQHFPDSPNQNHFPSTRITPENPLRSTTRFQFSVQNGGL